MFNMYLKIFILLFHMISNSINCIFGNEINELEIEVDKNGYICFCPCMGRFGNQADQFLGALAFAKRINRTLILPHWVEYIPYQHGSNQIPFEKYFKVETLEAYHKVITMTLFMDKLAPIIWPENKRYSFCYNERTKGKGCDAKEGNPFGPYWDNFKIDFAKSEIFGPNLHYILHYNNKVDWNIKYPGNEWPVLAFVGPPATFPIEEQNVHLHEYLQWSDEIEEKAKSFIYTLPRGPFIGIHLRNGMDWSKVCDLVGSARELFASPQCLGYSSEKGILTRELCFPTKTTILKHIKRGIKTIKATSIFVASDKDHMLSLEKDLKNFNVKLYKLPYESPHVDLAILAKSNMFIGNCISSFSSFVKRERDVNGFPSEFWAYPTDIKKNKNIQHEEL